MSRALAVAVCSAVMLGALPARAGDAAVVVLVEPSPPVDGGAEALVRLKGELVAAGFQVTVVKDSSGPISGPALEAAAREHRAAAAIAVVGGDTRQGAELWVVDRVTGKTITRGIAIEGDVKRAPEMLSIRALELLRASFLELAIKTGPAPAPPAMPAPVQVTRWVATTLDEARRYIWSVEAGAAVVGSAGGAGRTVAPTLRVARAFSERWAVRLGAAGWGTTARIPVQGGTADVAQAMALLEGTMRFRRDRRVQPIVSAGLGVLRLVAEASLDFPYQGRADAALSLAAAAGLGARIAVSRRLEVGAEIQVIFAQPYPEVRFFDERAASAGRPSIFFTLTAGAWM